MQVKKVFVWWWVGNSEICISFCFVDFVDFWQTAFRTNNAMVSLLQKNPYHNNISQCVFFKVSLYVRQGHMQIGMQKRKPYFAT